MKNNNFDIIFENLEYVDKKDTQKSKFEKQNEINIFDELIDHINYNSDTINNSNLDKSYKDYYSKIREGEFEEKCIGIFDENSDSRMEYKVSEIRQILNNSVKMADVFADIKNKLRDENIIEELKSDILLKDLKKNKSLYVEIYQKIREKLPCQKIESYLNIKGRYKNEFYDKFTNYIIEDYFDYGLLGKLMGEDSKEVIEISQDDFVTNLDIRNGWITYTTAFNRERKLYNSEKMSSEEVEIIINKLLRKGEALSASSTSINGIVPVLNYRIAVKHKSKTSSETHVVSIRRQSKILNMQYYMNSGFITKDIYDFFKYICKNSKNIIFSGATGTGKTTLINAIKQEFIKENESIIVLEDTPEIYIEGKAEVAFYSDEKKGSTDTDNFVDTLRHQPDRIIVGEIRKPGPARMLIQAANTGLSKGIMTTIHANSAADALRRLADIMKEGEIGQVNESLMSNKIRKSIDYVVQLALENINENGKILSKFVIKEIVKIEKEDPFFIIQQRIDKAKQDLEKLNVYFSKQYNIKDMNFRENQFINSKINYINSKINVAEIEIKYNQIKTIKLFEIENGCFKLNKIREYLNQYEL